MMAAPILAGLRQAARRRAVLDTLLIGTPPVLLAAVAAWRGLGTTAAVGAGLAALALVGAAAAWRARRFDRAWLVRELDARVPGFEDSTELLLTASPPRGAMAALQRARLESRIAEAAQVDLRPRWSRRAAAGVWVSTAVLIAAVLVWPEVERTLAQGESARSSRGEAAAGPPRITGTRLKITPPAYTGLPARVQTTLDARVPEGSRLEWTVTLEPQPSSAALDFPENGPVRLRRKGRGWVGARSVDRSMLYRIEAAGLARQRLHRIETVADAAPVVRPVSPAEQLAIVQPRQARWSPVFEAVDDYGVAGTATLRVTVTQGEGENITVKQRSFTVAGVGEPRRKRFGAGLDLAREGLAPGGDLIVQLVVSDNRAPDRHVVEGPSVILRWPAERLGAEGLDGMAMRVMPAYFRSQRQIIIDAEALLAQQRRMAPGAYLDRSNGLGDDQAQLRLRYGQFMGEEAEGGGGGGIALPTNDAPASPPTSEAAPEAPPEEAHNQPASDHDHDHAGEADASAPGAVDVLNDFGHAHDTGEADTLFDPGTRSTLSLALDAMWSSERGLRQGRPDEALPFAYRALELLKEAQQASRIFLQRTGPDLPPIDLSRRMTGEREGIDAGALPTTENRSPDAAPAEAWRALDERPGAPPLQLNALERWVRGSGARLSDPLALIAAIDTVRDDPGCLSCRKRLRALLWTALERPPAAVRRRNAPEARGRRYLDALR